MPYTLIPALPVMAVFLSLPNDQPYLLDGGMAWRLDLSSEGTALAAAPLSAADGAPLWSDEIFVDPYDPADPDDGPRIQRINKILRRRVAELIQKEAF